ncbi:hypothetical protein NE237_007722 [Protea cynaroides]|uniref:Uncharacterized protein n=1 Tax=Protea cynaroides TaxID=273540 RepID=A0A9Q0QWG5_9MAGN|nr:hypothetical protein NE237_007722 [Protea cynaroides]
MMEEEEEDVDASLLEISRLKQEQKALNDELQGLNESTFDITEEAALAYDKATYKLRGEFVRWNCSNHRHQVNVGGALALKTLEVVIWAVVTSGGYDIVEFEAFQVKMAADSNMGFHHDMFIASALNRHAISFQPGTITSTSGMISLGNSLGINSTLPLGNSVGVNSTSGMILTGNSSMINNNTGITVAGNSSSSLLLDLVPGLNNDTGLAVEWTPEEQSRLEEGLVKYADEPSIMRYIKIAATLRDKTVRDVALRCQWMTKEKSGKRRKPEDHYTGKKMKDRKEKLVESSSKASLPPVPPQNIPAYRLMMHHMDRDRILCEVPAAGSTTKQLLDENEQVFSQISFNIARFKIQDNIDLFCRTRNNITAILNDMREMPGIMSLMPPLPVSINDELANTIILPSTSETSMLSSSRGIHLKQEPGC